MDCTLCQEPITNPLCPGCLGEAMAEWIDEEAPTRTRELRSFTQTIPCEDGETCIRCGEKFIVCTYCHTKDVFNWLHDGALQLHFLRFFNFFT